MRANIHRWNSNSDGSFICPPHPPSQLRANYSDNRANPSAKLRFSALVSIARIDYIVHLRASTTGMVTVSPPSLVSLVHSDSHLHLRSFPPLSLCTRPFSRPPPPPDLTIPRGNYVATGKPSGICIERISFPRVARALCVEPNESRGYFC